MKTQAAEHQAAAIKDMATVFKGTPSDAQILAHYAECKKKCAELGITI